MSEQAPEINSQGPGGDTGETPAPENQPAPYSPYLEKLPESVRPAVEPIFKEWDAGVTQRFQQLHSQYGWAEPWQDLAKQYDPESVSQAIQLAVALENDPQGFYNALAQAYNFEQGTPGNQPVIPPGTPPEGELPEENLSDPRYDELAKTVGMLADIMLQDRQTTQESQEDQELIEHLQGLETQHGDFDWDFVLAKIAAGIDPEQAVSAYHQLVPPKTNGDGTNGGNGEAPVVIGGGGGTPSQALDPKKMDRRATQDLVASVLAANKQE